MKRILSTILLGIILGLSVGLLSGILLFSQFTPIHAFAVVCSIFLIVSLGLFYTLQHTKKELSALSLAKQHTEIQLTEQRHHFEVIFENANIGMALIKLDGHLFKTNKAFCELLGYSEQELLTINFFSLFNPNELTNLQLNIQYLIDQEINTFSSEYECFRKNGEAIWTRYTLSLVRDYANKPIYFVMQLQNISLQKKAEERLQHMAYHDPLTTLANRNKLEQFINHIIAVARRHQQRFAVLFLDLDRFKNINDTIGHEAGDMLLQVIAERLRSTVRNTDMVARLGGDEFVLLITDVKKTEAVGYIGQKILESVLKVIMINGREIYITTSIGISIYPYDGHDMQTIMKNADLALYRAKEHGRNNYQFYTSEMTRRAQEKLALQTALAHALNRNEFFLHYQPKMAIKTRRITGLEVLLRWKNKDYAMITPDEIIALAEETGLIIPVSKWVMTEACQQLKAWHDTGLTSLTMAINCSARQFKQATFIDDILRMVTEIGISPNSIEIEVTEALIMQDPENTLRILYGLKDIGVQIAIDDFGTGYWSLGNLRRLRVDKIKIDRSFIKQVVVDDASAAITRAIIAMVNKLGIISIAEGVETREQYEFLANEGCMEIQGYYLSKPLSVEAMSRFLQHPMPDAEVIEKEKEKIT